MRACRTAHLVARRACPSWWGAPYCAIGACARLVLLLVIAAGCDEGCGPRPQPGSSAATGRAVPDGATLRREGEGPLPHASDPFAGRYYLVGRWGADSLPPRPQHLLRGFGLLVVRQIHASGERVGVTRGGLRLPMRRLQEAAPSPFAGVKLDERPLAFGWVVRAASPVRAQPDAHAPTVRNLARLARVELRDLSGPRGYYEVQGGWMRADDLAIPNRASRPAAVGPRERWLDVDLASQTLVAYEGDRPRYAALVSTGIGRPGTPFATPVGVHRIAAKLRAARMDNLEHEGVIPYAYEAVPYTQYIGRVALHGTYWHDGFGIPRSHGCINLSLADAAWLFAFTRPELPAAAEELAAAPGKGTPVRVRGQWRGR